MYNKVIVALDLSDSSQKVVDTAIELVGGDLSKLTLAHAVEPIPTVWGMESYAIDPIELQGKIVDSAKGLLDEFATKVNIGKSHQHTMLGDPATEIRKFAAEQNADAIVMGSHGHSGWKLMLGSTATKLLHGATCDVLTVHVTDD